MNCLFISCCLLVHALKHKKKIIFFFNILLMLYSMQDGSLVVDCLKLADNTADLLTIKRRRCLDFAANLMKAPQNNKVNRTTNC